MNVTNATVLFRSDTAANFTSANTTLGNTTYNAPEAAYERDTKRIKIGVGNWTTIPYLPNASEVSAIANNVTTLQSNVTSINASLANKSNTTHTHNATTDLTSGTVPVARLPIANATSVGVVKIGANLTIDANGTLSANATGNSTSSGTDRGFMFDVRDYGAVLGASNGTTNTAAFQAAVDAAAVQSGGWGSGIVYIPATEIQYDTLYDLETPVWVWGNGITIQGEGKRATYLRGKGGPALVLAKHPRRWHVSKTSYTDFDNANATVTTTGTVSGETQLVNMERYKADLYEFRTGQTWEPGAQPEFAPSTITANNQYFAPRSRQGVVEFRYPYHPFATGDVAQSTTSCTSWPEHDKVTWEFVYHCHSGPVIGGLAGCGGLSAPDPWALTGVDAGGGVYDFLFDLALTDSDGIRQSWIRIRIAQPSGTGLHRLTIHFDPTNADSTKRIVAWVDRVRVTATPENWTAAYNTPYYFLNPPGGSGNDGLWTTWNRIARWRASDFTIFGEMSKIGLYRTEELGANSGGTTRSDTSLLAMAIHTELLYDVGAIGSSQQKIGGTGAADDSTVWAMTTNNENRQKALGWVCNTYDWSPNADLNLNVNLRGMTRGRLPVWGYICPKGNLFNATKNNAIKGLAIRRADGNAASCGLLLGPFLDHTEIEDVDAANAGYFASIGSMWTYVSYYLRLRSIVANRMIHLTHMTTDAETIDFNYCWRCAIRLTGSEFRLRNFSYPQLTAQSEGFLIQTAGASLGGEVHIRDGTINSEELMFMPWGPLFQLERMPDSPANGLWISNVQIGTFGNGVVRVDDYASGYGNRDFPVYIDRVKGITQSPIVAVYGSAPIGEIGLTPNQYMTDMISYEVPRTGKDFVRLKTIDRAGYGIPSTGGFIHDAHEVHVSKAPEGGVKVWRAWNPTIPTTVGYMGGANSPEWLPVEMQDTNRVQHALSSNIMPGFQAAVTLPWGSLSNTTTQFSGICGPFARLCLATILTGASAPNRSHMSLRWGLNSIYNTELTWYPNAFFRVDATTNSGKWASAASGSKSTNTTIATTGQDPDGVPAESWKVYLRRRWGGCLQIGDGTSTLAAWAFVTNVREAADWAVTTSDNPVIASGGITLSRAARPGGNWTHYAANRILDFFVGSSLSLSGPWFFGLSSSAINVTDGTGVTEPSSGSYARVSVTMNSTNWGEWFDSGFYANKTNIEFPSPTGDWGRLTHWFISDASSGGNIIACGPLNRAVRVLNGDGKPTWLPGAFQVAL